MQNLMFAIGTTTGPYHCSATTLARDVFIDKKSFDANDTSTSGG